MKHIKAISLLLALTLALTACSKSGGNSSEADESSQITESTLQSTSSAEQTSSIPEESEPEQKFPVVIYPKMSIKASGELEAALKPVEEFGRFYATYLFMDMYQEYLFEATPGWFNDKTKWFDDETDEYNAFYLVSKCGIYTYSDMMEKLDSMLTEKCIEDTAREIKNRFRAGENGELFVSRTGAGGYLGEDYLRLNKITYPDDATIVLDMSVIGLAEEWGYEQDKVVDFTITLKRTSGGWKIDEFGGEKYASHYDFYSLTMRFLQYNNVFLELDNRTEFSENYALEHANDTNKYYRPLNETEEIIKLLEDHAKPGETPIEGRLYLDSVEYPDENTILVKVSSRDVHEDGVTINAAATFNRTPDGLQLSACDPAILELFAHYSEIYID